MSKAYYKIATNVTKIIIKTKHIRIKANLNNKT